jgi:hypothetical protein
VHGGGQNRHAAYRCRSRGERGHRQKKWRRDAKVEERGKKTNKQDDNGKEIDKKLKECAESKKQTQLHK